MVALDLGIESYDYFYITGCITGRPTNKSTGMITGFTAQSLSTRIFAAIFVSLTLTAGQSLSADYSEEELGQIQDQAVHILGGNANVISRWNGPVQYGLITDLSGNDFDTDMDAVFAEIAPLSGLTIRKKSKQSIKTFIEQIERSSPHQLGSCESNDKCLNFAVVISDTEAMRQIANKLPLREVYQDALLADTAVCFFAPYERASVIFQSLIFVKNTPDTALMRTCLAEEIYQSFGMFNDYSESEYFSFNNRVQEKRITAADKALLKTVYEFQPGAPVFAVVKQFIKSNTLNKP